MINFQKGQSRQAAKRRIDTAWFLKAAIILAVVVVGAYRLEPVSAADKRILKPVASISYQRQNHIHGIGFDSQNQRLFVATHYGIFIWQNNKLFQLGDNRDDFMGFSLHPTNPNVIYTSGHPARGGNMGVMRSEDGGVTFKKILEGLQGEHVDFHAMTISVANPKILYGWFKGKLYRTKDGGITWGFASARGLPQEGFCFAAPCLAAEAKAEHSVYAGTRQGLLISRDFGETWGPVQTPLGAFAGVGVDPANSKRLLAFTQKSGISLSQDGGKTWQGKNRGLKLAPREVIFAFAFDAKNPKQVFAATPEGVFRSADGAESWKRIL
jgi:photosystem II stability/assembly factor-like uncharacterized protein